MSSGDVAELKQELERANQELENERIRNNASLEELEKLKIVCEPVKFSVDCSSFL